MAGIMKSLLSGSRHEEQGSSDFAFVAWGILVAIGMIVAAFALTVLPGIDPDMALSIFAAP